MDNKALLDQLMGKDRNVPTRKGFTEQWKDPSMCKPYILDFCPYELFSNTKLYLGNCRQTHSDIVKQQYESSQDIEKPTLTRKYELNLLTQLERILDTVDTRIRKSNERIGVRKTEFKLPADKQSELNRLHHEISVSMKQVEKLAEQGLLEESASLMSKVEELNNRATERKKELELRYFISEIVCEVCSTVSTCSVTQEGEWIDDHLRGRQHTGVERARAKVIEIKTKCNLPLSRRDREFKPSETIQHALRSEGKEVVIVDDGIEAMSPRSARPNHKRRSRSRSDQRRQKRRYSRRSRSPSTPKSLVSVTFD